MQYTEKELERLITEVEHEFTSHLAKAEEDFKLAKSEDGEKKPEEKEEPKEKPEAKEGEEAPAAEAKEAPAAEAKEGEAPAEAPAQEAAPAQEGSGYDAEDLEHMKKMYMSMSEPELKAHHDCIADLAKCGSIAPAAPHGALGQESPDNNAQPAVQKSEITSHDEASGGQIAAAAPPKAVPGAKSPASKVEGVQMQKSENAEVELLKSENETLKKNLEAVSTFITKLVEKRVAPAGKAITSLDVIAKSEGSNEEKTLSKGEIDTALSKKSQDPKLEKSDRDLINAYYLSSGSINSISHLLK